MSLSYQPVSHEETSSSSASLSQDPSSTAPIIRTGQHTAEGEAEAIELELLTQSGKHQSTHPSPSLRIHHAVALLVGLMVGSGLFASSGPIFLGTASPHLALGVWVISGGLAWMGALCYAELGASLPQDGGEVVYLTRAFGPGVAFLFEWVSILIVRPAGSAITLRVFEDHVVDYFHTPSTRPYISISALAFLTLIHVVSVRAGQGALLTMMALKILLLLLISLSGLLVYLNWISPDIDSLGLQDEPIPSPNLSSIVLAIYAGLWAFDGWNAVNVVSGQLRNPGRDLPRSIHISLPLLLGLYLCMNLAYFTILPPQAFSSPTLVALLARAICGTAGATFLLIAVTISTLGSTLASLYTGAHLVRSSALTCHLPQALAYLHPQWGTPVTALLVQAIPIALLLIASSASMSLEPLLSLCGITAWLFYASCTFALLLLRHRLPSLPRPYMAPLPAILLFLTLALLLLLASLITDPFFSSLTLVVLALGWATWTWIISPRLGSRSRSVNEDLLS
ncbi:MAG: amino acid permease-domain-containing protein [Piptocephalis tieghemiana]|nr:MAG: amino acid permease-domain-containing protein [Piptocephalis tieghemiana]